MGKIWYVFEDRSLRTYDEIWLPPTAVNHEYLVLLRNSFISEDASLKEMYDRFVQVISSAMREEAARRTSSEFSSPSPGVLDFIDAAERVGEVLESLGDVDRRVLQTEDLRQLREDRDVLFFEIHDADVLDIADELAKRVLGLSKQSPITHPGPHTSEAITQAGAALLDCWFSEVDPKRGLTSAVASAQGFFDAAFSLMTASDFNGTRRGTFSATAYAHSKPSRKRPDENHSCCLDVRSYRKSFRSALRRAAKAAKFRENMQQFNRLEELGGSK